MLLDAPFAAEEVTNAVSKLKVGKEAGSNGLVAVDLKAERESVVIWLRTL